MPRMYTLWGPHFALAITRLRTACSSSKVSKRLSSPCSAFIFYPGHARLDNAASSMVQRERDDVCDRFKKAHCTLLTGLNCEGISLVQNFCG